MPDPGYYSALFQDTLELRQTQQQDVLAKERLQKMSMEKQKMQMQQQERSLMMQAFQGGSDLRGGMDEATNLQITAQKLRSVGQRIMPFDPAKGTAMIREAGNLVNQKGMTDLRNAEVARKKNEILYTTAITVNDQASLNDAVGELAKAGVVVPPQYRQWGPEAQKYWGSRATIAKRNLDMIRADASGKRVDIQQQAKERRDREAKIRDVQRDQEAERKRIGVEIGALRGKGAAIDPVLQKQYDDMIERLESRKGKPAAAAGKFEAGKTYVDANGNRAKWNGTDWEPQ
jgi:hypothetical protein